MAQITLVGNLVAAPELHFADTGTAVTRFRVAHTERRLQDGAWTDGPTTYLSCSAFRSLAENCAESLRKGDRVVVTGRLRQNDYDKDGEKRTSYDLIVDDIGLSLRYATVSATRNQRTSTSDTDPQN